MLAIGEKTRFLTEPLYNMVFALQMTKSKADQTVDISIYMILTTIQ